MLIQRDIRGERRLNIDGRNLHIPTSIFIIAENGFCMELDRDKFLAGIALEFGLVPATPSRIAA